MNHTAKILLRVSVISIFLIASPSLVMGEDKSLTLQKDDLKDELGFILTKGDGTHKILYGVHTGVDINGRKRFF
jgi:hypothetical protein